MTIYEQLIDVCAGMGDRIVSGADVIDRVVAKFGAKRTSVFPSDYCYNRWNLLLGARQRPLFIFLGGGEFRYLGPAAPYTGLVYWRPKGTNVDLVVGEWLDGIPSYRPEVMGSTTQAKSHLKAAPASQSSTAGSKESATAVPMSVAQLERLYEEYMRILELEVRAFGCAPTETRHLIGRLGEIFCARHVGGQLVRQVNQAGFDVVASDGRRISVKTTAQKRGFVSFNERTATLADDIMVIRYANDAFSIVHHEPMREAMSRARRYGGRLELALPSAPASVVRGTVAGEEN